jgi:hypothetical protein
MKRIPLADYPATLSRYTARGVRRGLARSAVEQLR